MLTNITIKNFVIIESLDLEFKKGLTVITGETGAGKSIIIDAIELALGNRADQQQVGHFSDRCAISLTFNIEKFTKALSWLDQNEYQSDDDCIIRRVITKDGRSKAFINGHICTLQQVKEFASLLINIHGQHQHQMLLKKQHHRELLDYYAENHTRSETTKALYDKWYDLNKKIDILKSQNQDNTAQIDLLTYQVEELDQLNLSENEYQSLDQEHKRLANSESELKECQSALTKLTNQQDADAITLLNQSLNQLTKLPFKSEHIKSSIDLLSTAIVQVDETIAELRNAIDSNEINPEQLSYLDNRIQTILELSRKHHCNPESLFETHQKIKNHLDELTNADVNLEKLEQKLKEISEQYFKSANQLKKHRIIAAKKLSNEITKKMQQLSLAGGVFEIKIVDQTDNLPHPYGTETVEFHVSTNAGMPVQPINKVASGGEISRIALAIYVITAQKMITPTLLFDEVDVGIGGETADSVGQLLRQLAHDAQILSITHLPQVAAHGNQHLRVYKTQQQKTTHTQISELSPKERIEEIARMLGGSKITETTLAHAQEMLV